MSFDAFEHKLRLRNVLSDCAQHLYNINDSDLVQLRQRIALIDDEASSSYNNDNIIEKEYLVQNPNDNYNIPVSVYIPKNMSTYTSILIFIHGGGFMFFTRKTLKRTMSEVAQHLEKICISIDYRKSPEYKCPTALEDCMTVVQWVQFYKTELFSINKSAKIGICGVSSGGCLAARVAQRMRTILSFQILMFPWLHLKFMPVEKKELLSVKERMLQDFIEFSIKNYTNNFEALNSVDLSPLLNDDLIGLPKCLIISGEADPFVSDAFAYHKKLLDNGSNSKLHIIRGAMHTFNPYIDYMDAFLEVINELAGFLKHF